VFRGCESRAAEADGELPKGKKAKTEKKENKDKKEKKNAKGKKDVKDNTDSVAKKDAKKDKAKDKAKVVAELKAPLPGRCGFSVWLVRLHYSQQHTTLRVRRLALLQYMPTALLLHYIPGRLQVLAEGGGDDAEEDGDDTEESEEGTSSDAA
jgi:hypothetical protein